MEAAEKLLEYGLVPEGPEVIDSSMLKDFMDCPSKFYLRHVLGLKKRYPDLKDEAKFDWGTCWHSVLEAFWKHDRDLEAALTALEEHYPTYITPENDRYKRSKERMVKALFGYIEKWEADDKNYEILRLEQFFDVLSEEDALRWCGRIDQVRRRRDNGKIVVWDYKTSSAMGSNYFTMHEMGFQFPGYVWAVDQISTEPVKEIMVDVMYMITATTRYHRKSFRYDIPDVYEWKENVKMIIDQMQYLIEHHLYEPRRWIQNRNECTKYGPCQFIDVHKVQPKGDVRLRILQDDYMVDRWDPRDLATEIQDVD